MMGPVTGPTNPQLLLEVRFHDRRALRGAGVVCAETAAGMGITAEGCTHVRVLVEELVAAVLTDSFREGEPVDVTILAERTPAELTLTLDHKGAPTSFRRGKLPPRIDALIALGFADALEVGSAGIDGNRAVIRKSLPITSLTEDAVFTAQTADSPPSGDPGTEPLSIRVMEADDVVGVARLYFRTYGYTKILTPFVYDPDVFAALVTRGEHLGTVAETSSGRIVGHVGLTRHDASSRVGSADTLAVEPAFRKRGIVGLMGPVFGQHMISNGVCALFGEAVTMHTASQRAALATGARETAVLLAAQSPDVLLEGFDAVDKRRALILVYQRLLPLPAAAVYVPPLYADITQAIYANAGLDRTLATASPRLPETLADATVMDLELHSRQKAARIVIVQYGNDFLTVLLDLFHRLDRGGYEVDAIELPLSDPATALLGSGLGELGVCFNGVMPDDDGDRLLLSRCVSDLDVDAIQTASDFGTELRDFVVADYLRVAAQSDLRARSRAAMARIYEAL